MTKLVAREVTWQSKKIKSLPIQIIDGDRSSKYPKRNELQPRGVLFLNTKNVVQNRLDLRDADFITSEKFAQIKKGRLQSMDIVMTTRGSVGKVALFNNPAYPTGLINAQMLILRPDGQSIDSRFLFYLLCSDEFQDSVRNYSSGSAQPQIPVRDLQEIEIPHPPLSTQRKIASVLSAYDDLIENNTRRIEILEEMAQTIYQEWFVNFRFPGHEKAKMVESPLGQIPEGWEVKRLSDVASVYRGRSYRSKDLVQDGGLPFLNLKCIDRDGGFRHDGIKRYQGPYRETQTAKPGDIIMAVTDMTQERRIVARTARVPTNGQDKSVFSMDLVKVEPHPKLAAEYLYGMLRFSSFPDKVKQHANGANVLHLNPAHIEGYYFVLPPTEISAQYGHVCCPLYRESDVLHHKNDTLRRTRDLLLPKLISGEIGVEEFGILQQGVSYGG